MRNPRPVLAVLLATALFAPPTTTPLKAQEAFEVQEISLEAETRGPTDPVELEAFIDGVMHPVLEEFNTAGAVVTVVSGGEVFFSKGYGYSDWEGRVQVDPATTLFRIGSVSKLFVWTSVMQMVEQGLLDLDADVNEYLDFEIPPTYENPVTLSNILGHAGGFEDYVVELFGNEAEDVRPLGELLAEQIPARVRPNGDISSYSNHATGMAAYMVETVSGVEWKEYVEENIFEPLGMEYTTFRQPLPEDLETHMSKGYRKPGGRFAEQDFEYVPLAPVGAAAASGEDMARFMIAHLQLGQYGDQRILSEETARLMQSDHHQMDPQVNGMAHGFMGYSTHGERIIGHGGDTQIFHTGLWIFPERNLGVFVSFNSAQAGGARGRVFAAFMDHYFPAGEVLSTPDEEFQERAKRYTGEYRANRFSHTTIGKLAAVQTTSVSATSRGTLRALESEWVEETPLVFREAYGDRKLIFREDKEGHISHFMLSSTAIAAWERPPVSEHPGLNVGILILAVVSMVLTLLSPILGWIIRRWFKIPGQELKRIPGRARLSLWLAALLFGIGLLLILSMVASGDIAVEIPTGMGLIFLVPVVAVIPTLISVFFAFRMWRKGQGRPTVRFFYSVATLAFCLLIWQMNTWNLLGWNY